MTTDQLQTVLKAAPYRPFVLKTGSGAIYAVNHPEMVLVMPSGRTIVVTTGDDTFAVLDLLLVEAIEVGSLARS